MMTGFSDIPSQRVEDDPDWLNEYYTYPFNESNYYDDTYDPAIVNEGAAFRRRWFLWVSPILLLVGLVGNVISLVVLQGRAFRKVPSTFILSVLALVDIAVLYTGLLRHWILALTGDDLDVRVFNDVTCKLHVFLSYLFPQLSGWTLTLMTLERLFFVVYPFSARTMSRKKLRMRMALIWSAIFLSLFAVNAHAFKTIGIEMRENFEKNLTEKKCWTDKSYFSVQVWSPLDAVLSSILPGFIIAVSNVLVVVFKSRMLLRPLGGGSAPNANGSSAGSRGGAGGELRVHRLVDDSQSRSITIMLISISILFIASTTPSGVYFVVFNYWPQQTSMDIYRNYLAFTFVNLIMYTNNALNFVMYCVSGARFRRALVALLCCRKGGRASIFSQTYNTAAITASNNNVNMARRLSVQPNPAAV